MATNYRPVRRDVTELVYTEDRYAAADITNTLKVLQEQRRELWSVAGSFSTDPNTRTWAQNEARVLDNLIDDYLNRGL